MRKKIRSAYAIPCLVSAGSIDPDEVFFLTFGTKDEDEALRLASCVCGKANAEKTLVIINERGQIFSLY